ncbi:NRDE family protein [Cyclobacteriaceae bacterium]|nr:NRDE family protein [Cyclobacteriaceae bacterium]
MCTVTFLPKKRGFILTSNRDEDIKRASEVIFPNSFEFDEDIIVFPKDPRGGGSWIAADNKGKAVCLLNGGFEKHERKDSYRKSRGLVVIDAFGYDNTKSFASNYDFTGIEPFTLVVCEYEKGQTSLHQIVWDEKKVHYSKLDNKKPHIWSSSTLYTPEVRGQREAWFVDFLRRGDFSIHGIKKFHQFGGEGDNANNLVMKRGDILSTVSITAIEIDDQGGEFQYQDLLKNETKREFL